MYLQESYRNPFRKPLLTANLIGGFPMYDDANKSVWGTRFPLFCLRESRISGPEALEPVWLFIAWSLNCCYLGTVPEKDANGHTWSSHGLPPGHDIGFRCRLSELRGDWKWHYQCFGLKSTWMSDYCCHRCCATKSKPAHLSYVDFRAQPHWLTTERDQQRFLSEQLPEDRNWNPILYTIGFNFRRIRICSMHTCQLGIGLHLNGSAFHELMAAGVFKGDTATERYKHAYSLFRQWCRQHKISCSQSCFKPWMLVTGKGEDFCFFQTKDTWR